MTQVTERIRNGVDTERLFATLDAISAQPEMPRDCGDRPLTVCFRPPS
jgi:hypothetical protein